MAKWVTVKDNNLLCKPKLVQNLCGFDLNVV